MTDPEKRVLYISYDGMTDPLGQSQVIPYLTGLSERGYQFTILSCEKEKRFLIGKEKIKSLLDKHKIRWCPIKFNASPPIAAKYWDLLNLYRTAVKLQREQGFALVHCRSYVAANIGLKLKQIFGVKFLFDMRGFWVDERVDGGLWNLSNPIYGLAYKIYKRKEASYIQNADHIIILTEAGRKELETWKCYTKVPITVIPCCVELDTFPLKTSKLQKHARIELQLPTDDLVLSYLGSLGTWYMLDEMLLFFKMLKVKYPRAKFLFLTPDSPNLVYEKLPKYGLDQDDIKIKFAQRDQVAKLISASNISLSFIKPSYSKVASCPTKLGELLVVGIPVINNAGLGDVKEIITSTKGGMVIDDFSEKSLNEAVAALPDLLKKQPEEIREAARAYFDLKRSLALYTEVYKSILENQTDLEIPASAKGGTP